ncbi:hypothetical protein EDB80DRAFT_727748 [Ilyonectria destructans]|nr:hypothetical protein EDB80DRAFT_727748 [Ilyonectria destructans]
MVPRVLVAAVVALSCLIVGTEASPCSQSPTSITTSNTPTPSSSSPDTTSATTSETPSSTSDSSTTTTTTSTAPTSILINGHFDNEPPTTSPWETTGGTGVGISFSLDDVIRQGGARSGKLVFSGSAGLGYLRQALDMSKITPGASYQATGWIRTSDSTECSNGYMICAWNTLVVANAKMIPLDTAVNQFQQISTPCTWSQSQYDAGGLYIYVGFLCGGSGEGWVDTVDLVAL